MKPTLCIKPDVEAISLNDCLACSGCITEEESQRFKSDLACLEDTTSLFSFIISRESKKNLKNLYPELEYSQFERMLTSFLKKHFNTFLIVDASYFLKQMPLVEEKTDKTMNTPAETNSNNVRDKNLKESNGCVTSDGFSKDGPYLSPQQGNTQSYQYLNDQNTIEQNRNIDTLVTDANLGKNKENKDIDMLKNRITLSSECPAVVLYIERVYPDLLKYLDRSQTYQQIAASFIKEKLREESSKLDTDKHLSHKIISIQMCYDKKDELKRDRCGIDYFVGTKDFYQFIKDKININNSSSFELEEWEKSYLTHPESISGLENCINIFNKIKSIDTSIKGIYDLSFETDMTLSNLELRICKGGCFKGPAQVPEGKENDEDLFHLEKSNFYFKTSDRIFNKPKKTNFKIDW